MVESVLQLRCGCNEYPWGKQGKQSLAADLCSRTPGTDFKIDESKCYSEMWMGTYPELPSYVLSTGENLQDVLNANKEQLMGSTVLQKFGADLPFLPKILSIAKALPLQIHPDKDLASRLHSKNPDKFTDDNHKPEIAVALSEFELFVGFKPLNEIQELFQLPTLKRFIPSNPSGKTSFNDETLRRICGSILTAPEETIAEVHADLNNLSKTSLAPKSQYILDLLPRVQVQYTSKDPGNLVALLLMNFLKLPPGSCVYVPGKKTP